jgi:hypothetical protein
VGADLLLVGLVSRRIRHPAMLQNVPAETLRAGDRFGLIATAITRRLLLFIADLLSAAPAIL